MRSGAFSASGTCSGTVPTLTVVGPANNLICWICQRWISQRNSLGGNAMRPTTRLRTRTFRASISQRPAAVTDWSSAEPAIPSPERNDMLTLPVEANEASRVLVIGRSELVLSETVRILRRKGHAAGASNDFDHVLSLFDMAAVDVVVFGGMVPPETKEHLRQQIKGRHPEVVFVQGFAGIPGLIADQVQAALTAVNSAEVRPAPTYAAQTRTVALPLDR